MLRVTITKEEDRYGGDRFCVELRQGSLSMSARTAGTQPREVETALGAVLLQAADFMQVELDLPAGYTVRPDDAVFRPIRSVG